LGFLFLDIWDYRFANSSEVKWRSCSIIEDRCRWTNSSQMGPISESHLEGVHPKDVSSALRIQSGSACFLQIFVKSVVTFFIKTWQGNLMMRIISDGKGGHWGRCGAVRRSSSEDPLLCGANDVICHWLAGIVFLAERHPAPLYHPRERERAPKPIASAKGQRRSGTFFWHAWRQRQANGSIS
jgi:hypothetical protein